jgi:hypothetical protein
VDRSEFLSLYTSKFFLDQNANSNAAASDVKQLSDGTLELDADCAEDSHSKGAAKPQQKVTNPPGESNL